ncbi:hypothetical protein N8387_03980, partial [Polaribacter sp.]|nr:hypothetical protein [Polaribacter sp.]
KQKEIIDREKLSKKLDEERELKLKLDEERELKLKLDQDSKLTILKNQFILKYDKDENGTIDLVEEKDEINILLNKHQKIIVEKGKEYNQNYIQQFIKVSNYLKDKRKNIQLIFESLKDEGDLKSFENYVEVLDDDIHSYNLILFNSLNLIVSLIDDNQIAFYQIYETFDTLNMFDSKHEKDVSQKLTNIGDGLKDLMDEVRRMGNKISNSIDQLSYVTEQSNEQLSNQLSEIDSTMKVGNLINTINTYQNYKNNRNTKNLRG